MMKIDFFVELFFFQDSDSDDSDIEMFEPPEPTVDRGWLLSISRITSGALTLC